MPIVHPATDARIESLLARMTVEEKVGQLGVFADMVRPFAPDVNPEVNVSNAAQVLEQVRAGIWVMLESHTEEKRRDKKMVERVNDLDETIKSMKEEYGRKVSIDEVAERMGITEDTVEDILKLAGEEVKDE